MLHVHYNIAKVNGIDKDIVFITAILNKYNLSDIVSVELFLPQIDSNTIC